MQSIGRPRGRFFFFCVLIALLACVGVPSEMWAAPQKTSVVDVLYRADGSPASGTVTIRWIVGNGNEGKMQELEMRVQKQEALLQRLAGVGASLMALITIFNLAINSWRFLGH